MPVLSPLGEAVHAALRKMNLAAQAVVLRVDATMLAFDVYAQLVSNNTDFLQRHHYLESVIFSDGPTGDDGLVYLGTYQIPDESVVFTDGLTGDDGLVIWIPIAIDGTDESVVFSEIDYKQAWAIHDDEFVNFTDFAISYMLAFDAPEQLIFSDISIAWIATNRWDESVLVGDSLTALGGNSVALAESITISEVLLGANTILLGDSWAVFEFWDTGLAFPVIFEAVVWTDKLVVSVVAATDARPGAFVPGSALLGQPDLNAR